MPGRAPLPIPLVVQIGAVAHHGTYQVLEDGTLVVRCSGKEKRHPLAGENPKRAAERVLRALVTKKR